MLVNRPSAFIFQQIILPYLASTTTTRAPHPAHQQRHFSSSSTTTRPYELGQATQQRANTWEPYPSSNAGSSSRRRTREYLEFRANDPKNTGVDGVEGGQLESYRRTTALALERIIQSHQTLGDRGTSTRDGIVRRGADKGKRKAELGSGDKVDELERAGELGLGQGVPGSDRVAVQDRDVMKKVGKGKEKAREVDSEVELDPVRDAATIDEPRPTVQYPNTHQTPQSTLSTISSSTTTSTTTSTTHPFPPLIHQLLQARQFRLTALHILNLPLYALDQVLVDRVAAYMVRHGGGKVARRLRRGPTPSPQERSLMSDPDIEQRLPGGYWTILKSSRPPPRTLDDLGPSMPEIEMTQSQKFTAFCNLQLAHSLSSSSKGIIPPSAFPRPTSSLKQLRALLSRINKLEQHRGFIPDRVTANLILSCLLRCSLRPPPSGTRIVKSKTGWKVSPRHVSSAQGQFGSGEMKGLFETISKLIDRSILAKDEGLSYTRHVKPFVKLLQRGFGELGDGKGLEMVRKWDKQVRSVLEERRSGTREGGNGHD